MPEHLQLKLYKHSYVGLCRHLSEAKCYSANRTMLFAEAGARIICHKLNKITFKLPLLLYSANVGIMDLIYLGLWSIEMVVLVSVRSENN